MRVRNHQAITTDTCRPLYVVDGGLVEVGLELAVRAAAARRHEDLVALVLLCRVGHIGRRSVIHLVDDADCISRQSSRIDHVRPLALRIGDPDNLLLRWSDSSLFLHHPL